jgi:hypothetical protein
MRRRQRYTVHRRLLLTFLLLGCAGSFVLGQELARTLAAIPVYAAQSPTFSGAGITASLVTPIQVSGSIGQPTPQPKVVKHRSKPDNKPQGKSPPTKPALAPQQTPVNSPPNALQGTPVTAPATTPRCASASCLPGVTPPPPGISARSAAPTGGVDSASGSSTHSSADATSGASAPETPVASCASPSPVSHPTTSAHGNEQTQCSSTATAIGASSANSPNVKTPKPGAPVVIETPGVTQAPLIAVPAPVTQPVVPVPAMDPTLVPAGAPAETTALSSAGNDPQASLAPTSADQDTQNTPITPATPATDQQQP